MLAKLERTFAWKLENCSRYYSDEFELEFPELSRAIKVPSRAKPIWGISIIEPSRAKVKIVQLEPAWLGVITINYLLFIPIQLRKLHNPVLVYQEIQHALKFGLFEKHT